MPEVSSTIEKPEFSAKLLALGQAYVEAKKDAESASRSQEFHAKQHTDFGSIGADVAASFSKAFAEPDSIRERINRQMKEEELTPKQQKKFWDLVRSWEKNQS